MLSNAKHYYRNGTADESIPCLALNDLSIKQVSNEATNDNTVDMDMTQEPKMAAEAVV